MIFPRLSGAKAQSHDSFASTGSSQRAGKYWMAQLVRSMECAWLAMKRRTTEEPDRFAVGRQEASTVAAEGTRNRQLRRDLSVVLNALDAKTSS